MPRPRKDRPRWQETGLRAEALPAIAASPDGSAMLVVRDPEGSLRLASVARSGRVRVIRRPLGPCGPVAPVTLACRDGRTAIAWQGERGPMAACVDPRGEGEAVALDPAFPEPLAWVEDAEEGLLLLAGDDDRRVGLLRFGRGERRWEPLGPLDEVLEGPLEGVPAERPAAD
ncbi:MAG: hypothetical protein U1E14_01355 [Geminicoccaceae bacterium]